MTITNFSPPLKSEAFAFVPQKSKSTVISYPERRARIVPTEQKKLFGFEVKHEDLKNISSVETGFDFLKSWCQIIASKYRNLST